MTIHGYWDKDIHDEVKWDMTIHGYWDKDIHDASLVGRMEWSIFLFSWMDESGWDKSSSLIISIILK
jgi:hypothetical protein